MKKLRRIPIFLSVAAVAAAVFLASPSALRAQGEAYPVPPPPITEGMFPCTDCHDPEDYDPRPRELGEHENIELRHAEELRWCLDCHDATDRDSLFLQNGDRIGFEESHRLCGQCHGPVYRDWRAGIHGRRTGYWNGRKEYLLCAHCHDPHMPQFRDLKPEPPPKVPGGGGH